jgi:propionyl-CoA carboxylase alpha chain
MPRTRSKLPLSIGRLTRYCLRPRRSDGVTARNDTGVTEGGEISIHYDPMIAKLVTHGPTRAIAIAAQFNALMPSSSTASATTFRFFRR